MKNYGIISKPLTNLLKKDSFVWSLEVTQAFQQLQKAMCSAPVLRMPEFSKSFVIETDASTEGMGAVLMQEGRPIAYLSKAFNTRNRGLSTYEKELMALVQAVTKWRHYLIGHHFIIMTDHQSLKHLLEQKLTTPMQHKWLSKLWGLDYSIQYKQGSENKIG